MFEMNESRSPDLTTNLENANPEFSNALVLMKKPIKNIQTRGAKLIQIGKWVVKFHFVVSELVVGWARYEGKMKFLNYAMYGLRWVVPRACF